MIRSLLFIFLISLSALGTVQARSYSLKSLKRERISYEQKLQADLQSRIEAVVPKTHFILKTDVELKVILQEAKVQVVPEYYIGKLGTVKGPKPERIPPRRIFRSTFGDNIRKVNVQVILDETIPEGKVVDIQQIVKTMVTVVPWNRIDFQTTRMVIVGRKFGKVVQDYINSFNKFTGENRTIFFIFVGLMIFFTGVFLFSRMVKKSTRSIGKVGDRILNFLEAKHLNEVRHRAPMPAPPKKDEPSLSEGEAELEERRTQLLMIQKELSYFIKSANERPIRLGLLINQWIHDRPMGFEEGLALIPHIIHHEVFSELMKNLNNDTKEKLSSYIGTPFSEVNYKEGRRFLQSHLPYMYQSDEDSRFESIVLSMTKDECIEVIKRDPDLGALILNALPNESAENILKGLAEVIVGSVIDSSLQTDISQPVAERRLKELVEAVREERAASIPPSFMTHIIRQLQSVSPEREKGIFEMFRETNRTEVLYTISKEVFPSELILKLPSTIIKLVLSSFSIEGKARLILSLSHEDQEVLKTMIFDKGSREERFISMEIEKLEASPEILADIKANAGETWRSFAHAVRRFITTDKQAQKDANRILENWIYSKRSGVSEAHLKKVS